MKTKKSTSTHANTALSLFKLVGLGRYYLIGLVLVLPSQPLFAVYSAVSRLVEVEDDVHIPHRIPGRGFEPDPIPPSLNRVLWGAVVGFPDGHGLTVGYRLGLNPAQAIVFEVQVNPWQSLFPLSWHNEIKGLVNLAWASKIGVLDEAPFVEVGVSYLRDELPVLPINWFVLPYLGFRQPWRLSDKLNVEANTKILVNGYLTAGLNLAL
jgi:hypothetical protein